MAISGLLLGFFQLFDPRFELLEILDHLVELRGGRPKFPPDADVEMGAPRHERTRGT